MSGGRGRREDAARLRGDLERLGLAHGLDLAEPLAWLDRFSSRVSADAGGPVGAEPECDHLGNARAALELTEAALAHRDAEAQLREVRAARERRLEPLESARDALLSAAADSVAAHDRERLANLLAELRDEERRWGPVLDLDEEVERLERTGVASSPGGPPVQTQPWWLSERGQAALRRMLSHDEPVGRDVPSLAFATARRDLALAAALRADLSEGEIERGWGRVAEERGREIRARVELLEQELRLLRAELEAADRLAKAIGVALGREPEARTHGVRGAVARLIETKELALHGHAFDVDTLDAEQSFDHAWRLVLRAHGGESGALAPAREARERVRRASAAVLSFGLLGSEAGRAELNAARRRLRRALNAARDGHERHRRTTAAACRARLTTSERPLHGVLEQWRRFRDLRASRDPVELDALVTEATAELEHLRALVAARPGADTRPDALAEAWVRRRALDERLETLCELRDLWARGGAGYRATVANLIDVAERALATRLADLLSDPAEATSRPALAAAHADLERAHRAEQRNLAAAVRRVFGTRARLDGVVESAGQPVRELGLVHMILGE